MGIFVNDVATGVSGGVCESFAAGYRLKLSQLTYEPSDNPEEFSHGDPPGHALRSRFLALKVISRRNMTAHPLHNL